MPFSYYDRLSPRRQAVYRQSDRVVEIRLPRPQEARPLVAGLRQALAGDNRRAVERAASALSAAVLEQFRVDPLHVQVLAVRPHGRYGELHGLYTFGEKDPPRIKLWMRTARHRRVVAFRSFLRTLLHELAHHLDYRYLKLSDSYHTEGFFKRESSLFRQLVPEEARRREPDPPAALAEVCETLRSPAKPARRRGASEPADAKRPAREPVQGFLPFDE